jgi:hypothetical protein
MNFEHEASIEETGKQQIYILLLTDSEIIVTCRFSRCGGVAERLNAPVLKTGIG